jgi:hypothetical protein
MMAAKIWSAASSRNRFCAAGPLDGPRESTVSITVVRARSMAARTAKRPARVCVSQSAMGASSVAKFRVARTMRAMSTHTSATACRAGPNG